MRNLSSVALVFSITVSCGSVLQAASPWSVQAGVSHLSSGLNRHAADATGKPGLLGTSSYQFLLQYHTPVSGLWQFSPALNWMPEFLMPRQGDSVKVSHLILSLPATYQVSSLWDVSLGLAIVRSTLTGEGGVVTLNNGTGTSQFARPGQSKTAQTLAVTGGGAANFSWGRIGLDALVEGFTHSEKRTSSLLLSVGFKLKGGL